jgi:hypothetical protein
MRPDRLKHFRTKKLTMDSSSVVNKLFTEIQRHENQIDAWCRTQKEEIQRSQRQHIDFSKEADSMLKSLHSIPSCSLFA